MRTRRRQRLATTVDGETVYLVRSGVLALHASTPSNRRQILRVMFAGDLFHSAGVPLLPETALTAVAPGELLRVRWSWLEPSLATDAGLMSCYLRLLAGQQARDTLHVAAISSLSGEQRVASFLVELALRSGRRSGAGMMFELPLARADIADYLALNADTLSRIMSRLKAKDLVTLHRRGQIIARNFAKLCLESPHAEALRALQSQSMQPA